MALPSPSKRVEDAISVFSTCAIDLRKFCKCRKLNRSTQEWLSKLGSLVNQLSCSIVNMRSFGNLLDQAEQLELRKKVRTFGRHKFGNDMLTRIIRADLVGLAGSLAKGGPEPRGRTVKASTSKRKKSKRKKDRGWRIAK